jgi:hypothetical protein
MPRTRHGLPSGDASGLTHWTSRKRAKSVSAEQTVRPCSIASAARCASLTRFPRSW